MERGGGDLSVATCLLLNEVGHLGWSERAYGPADEAKSAVDIAYGVLRTVLQYAYGFETVEGDTESEDEDDEYESDSSRSGDGDGLGTATTVRLPLGHDADVEMLRLRVKDCVPSWWEKMMVMVGEEDGGPEVNAYHQRLLRERAHDGTLGPYKNLYGIRYKEVLRPTREWREGHSASYVKGQAYTRAEGIKQSNRLERIEQYFLLSVLDCLRVTGFSLTDVAWIPREDGDIVLLGETPAPPWIVRSRPLEPGLPLPGELHAASSEVDFVAVDAQGAEAIQPRRAAMLKLCGLGRRGDGGGRPQEPKIGVSFTFCRQSFVVMCFHEWQVTSPVADGRRVGRVLGHTLAEPRIVVSAFRYTDGSRHPRPRSYAAVARD